MTLDTSSRASIRQAEKAAERAERAKGEVVVNLMSTAPGRQFVWERLESAGIFRTSFSTNPIQMAFNEGCRNAGIELLAIVMQFAPDAYIQAMREANERATIDRANSPKRDVGEQPGGEDAGRDLDEPNAGYNYPD